MFCEDFDQRLEFGLKADLDIAHFNLLNMRTLHNLHTSCIENLCVITVQTSFNHLMWIMLLREALSSPWKYQLVQYFF